MTTLFGRNRYIEQILTLVVLSYFFLMMGNSVLSLTNPDEVFYTQTAKEMMQQKSWLTPYLFGQPQFEKPIFTFWFLRLAFEMFGISSFSARLFPALFGILGVLGVYGLGLVALGDTKRAMWSAVVMMSSSLYIGLSRTVFTDLFFTVLILFSLAAFFCGYSDKSKKTLGLLSAFIFSGFAVLTKGPLGFIIPGLTILVYLLIKREIRFLLCWQTFLGFLIFSLLSMPWYVFMIKKYGSSFVQEFFYNDHIRRLIEAEHKSNDTWYFYPASIIGCMMPWGIYTLGSFISLFAALKKNFKSSYLFFACWIVVTFLIFQPAHSKLVSYIFPLFPALSLLVGDYIGRALEGKTPRFYIFASWATTIFFLVLPAGLIFATIRFSEYVVDKTPIYVLVGFIFIYIAILFVLLMRKDFLKHTALVSAILPILLYFAFIVHDDFDAYASSNSACKLLVEKYKPQGKLLASKFYARGVRFFTDLDVAVIDIAGSGYFSPHPIEYLNDSRKLKAFIESQSVTYAVLKKGSFQDLKRIVSADFNTEILNVCGDEYVVKVSRR